MELCREVASDWYEHKTHRVTSHRYKETLSARIAAAISSFHLFGVKIFWVEISYGRKKLARKFWWVECASGADMAVESDFAVVHNLY